MTWARPARTPTRFPASRSVRIHRAYLRRRLPATALGSPLPGSLDRKGGSLGVGLHAQWQGGNARNRWYLRGAVAANTQGIERTRKVMDYTEAGSGNSRIKAGKPRLSWVAPTP